MDRKKIWHKIDDCSKYELGDWPEFNRKLYIHTVHGYYLGHTNDISDIYFDQPIHWNGPIQVPMYNIGMIKRWRYVTDEEYDEIKGFKLAEE